MSEHAVVIASSIGVGVAPGGPLFVNVRDRDNPCVVDFSKDLISLGGKGGVCVVA